MNFNIKFFLSSLCVVFIFSSHVNAQYPVNLDPTFGVNGKVTTQVNQVLITSSGNQVVVKQQDDKIVVVKTYLGSPIVYRYLTNGNLDPTWGQNGVVSTPQHSGDVNLVSNVFQQDNGQIIVTGVKDTVGFAGTKLNYMIKYNTDGTLDQNFGTGGMANYWCPGTESLNASFIMDSSIYLVNLDGMNLDSLIVYSYNINTGLINNAFGNNGKKYLDLGMEIYLQGISVRNNKILFLTSNLSTNRLYQYNANFDIDSSFGTNGYISMSNGSPTYNNFIWRYTTCESAGISHFIRPIIQDDDKIILAGISSDTCNVDGEVVVERFLPNGDKDLGFATNGVLTFDFRSDNTELNYVKNVNELTNGYILVVGGVHPKYNPSTTASIVPTVLEQKFAMALFDDQGNPVPSFGTNGVYVENNFHASDTVDILLNSFVQQDGKVVLVGYTPHYSMFDAMTNHSNFQYGMQSTNLSRYTIERISEGGGVDLKKETKNDFTIYPNPTNSILNIQSDNVIQGISIYNYLGELVIQENGQALNQINVERLNKGIYVMRMTGKEGNVFNGKFVKE